MLKLFILIVFIDNILISFGHETFPNPPYPAEYSFANSVGDLKTIGKDYKQEQGPDTEIDWGLWFSLQDVSNKNIPLAKSLLHTYHNKLALSHMVNAVGRRGGDDEDQHSVLDLAIESKDIVLVRKLISARADINLQNYQMVGKKRYGRGEYPLFTAVIHNFHDAVRLLLNRPDIKIDVQIQIKGMQKPQTAIEYASDAMKHYINMRMCIWLEDNAKNLLTRDQVQKRDDFMKHIPFREQCGYIKRLESSAKSRGDSSSSTQSGDIVYLFVQAEGASAAPIPVTIPKKKTIADLKQIIATKTGIAVAKQKLMNTRGTVLENKKSISSYGMEDGNFILHLTEQSVSTRQNTPPQQQRPRPKTDSKESEDKSKPKPDPKKPKGKGGDQKKPMSLAKKCAIAAAVLLVCMGGGVGAWWFLRAKKATTDDLPSQ